MDTEKSTMTKSLHGYFFMAKPCLHVHLHLFVTRQREYLETLKTICDTGVGANLSQPTKAHVLAVLHMTGQYKIVDEFLKHCDVVEITKAAQILDRPRRIKQLECRIANIEQAHPHLKEETQQLEKSSPPKMIQSTKGYKTRGRAKRSMMETKEPLETKKRKRQIDFYRSELKKQLILIKGTHSSRLPCAEAHSNTAVCEIVASASLSGAFARKVRRFAHVIKADFLEFILMSGSMEYWKTLADLVHFRPTDFALPYFLSAVHGGELPEGSFVEGMMMLCDAPDEELFDQFQALEKSHPQQLFQAFNYLRTQPRYLRSSKIAEIMATNIPVTTAISYLEELAQSSSKVPGIVSRRLRQESWMAESSKVTESFGKLLERILTFRSFRWEVADDLMSAAERRLNALKETWADEDDHGLTVIFGDKSYSMESAIRAATIMAAMISTCFRGELSFFDHLFRRSPHTKPCTVKHVLDICQQIRASGATSLAAALWPFYDLKKKIDRIILVTDEQENTPCNGYMFAPLLRLYKDTVNKDVELVVICIDKGDNAFRISLDRNSIDCRRIEIDGIRPDLSKFDSMLSQIALLSKTAVAAGPATTDATSRSKVEDEEDSRIVDDFVVLDDNMDEGW